MNDNRDRREFWLAHWRRCRELGMTLKEYARQEGLTVSVFYGWSKRFKRQEKVSPTFTQVALLPETTDTEFRLCFPNGLVLEWRGVADLDHLSKLVRSLT